MPTPTLTPHIADITHAIQLAVAPVFLLTAIATMISVMSGRLSRVIDRRRVIRARLASPGNADDDDRDELRVLDRRGRSIYFAIFSAVLAALLVCLVVASAFLGVLVAVDVAELVAALFILAMTAMIVALGLFLREVFLAVITGGHQRR
jgi:hypothetical protein